MKMNIKSKLIKCRDIVVLTVLGLVLIEWGALLAEQINAIIGELVMGTALVSSIVLIAKVWSRKENDDEES